MNAWTYGTPSKESFWNNYGIGDGGFYWWILMNIRRKFQVYPLLVSYKFEQAEQFLFVIDLFNIKK